MIGIGWKLNISNVENKLVIQGTQRLTERNGGNQDEEVEEKQ